MYVDTWDDWPLQEIKLCKPPPPSPSQIQAGVNTVSNVIIMQVVSGK
jgi:hypothetical protein